LLIEEVVCAEVKYLLNLIGKEEKLDVKDMKGRGSRMNTLLMGRDGGGDRARQGCLLHKGQINNSLPISP
jgi:hypothetical protein